MRRRHIINALAGLVIGLLLVLRRRFAAVIDGDRSQARHLRSALVPALVILATFLAVATWALVEAGYPVVALLLLVHVALLVSRARR